MSGEPVRQRPTHGVVGLSSEMGVARRQNASKHVIVGPDLPSGSGITETAQSQ